MRKNGGEYFIVIGARTWSRGHSSVRGQCGSGTESYIEWLRVSERLIVQRAKALYESCWENRDGWAIGWHGPLFTIETEELIREPRRPDEAARWRQLKWTFDVEHPDAGFRETIKVEGEWMKDEESERDRDWSEQMKDLFILPPSALRFEETP